MNKTEETGNCLSESLYDYLLLAFRYDVTVEFRENLLNQIDNPS